MPTPTPPLSLDVRVPADFRRIPAVRHWIEGFLASEGWSEDDTADVGLVATEVLQNAVEHGSAGARSEAITLTCTIEPGGALLLEVHDPGTGKGLAALLARDVSTAPPADAARGRGLFLVHRMVQSLERCASPRGGSLVRVRYRATPGGPA